VGSSDGVTTTLLGRSGIPSTAQSPHEHGPQLERFTCVDHSIEDLEVARGWDAKAGSDRLVLPT